MVFGWMTGGTGRFWLWSPGYLFLLTLGTSSPVSSPRSHLSLIMIHTGSAQRSQLTKWLAIDSPKKGLEGRIPRPWQIQEGREPENTSEEDETHELMLVESRQRTRYVNHLDADADVDLDSWEVQPCPWEPQADQQDSSFLSYSFLSLCPAYLWSFSKNALSIVINIAICLFMFAYS